MINIADILLTLASMGFVLADLKQGIKLYQNRYSLNAFSHTHFKLKLLSLTLVIIAYFMLSVFMALMVAIIQLLVNIYISNKIGVLHLKKYYKNLAKESKDIVHFIEGK